MRFDGHKYVDCRWCCGFGCLYCEGEADRAYKAQFPDGPKPLATFSADELSSARKAIGREAIEKAFGSGGGDIAEIEENIRAAKPQEKPE